MQKTANVKQKEQNTTSDRILIIGHHLRLPDTGAETIHAFRLAQTIKLAGLHPRVLLLQSEGRSEDIQPDGGFQYDGIPYVPVGDFTAREHALRRLGTYLGLRNPIFSYLQRQSEQPESIIAMFQPSGFLIRLALFCWIRGIGLISQSAEWSDLARLQLLSRLPQRSLATTDDRS